MARRSRPSDEALATWERWLRVHRQLLDAMDHELRAQCDLPLDEYDVLLQLRRAGDQRLRMSHLAEALLISRSSCTRLVERLERRGWVTREPDHADRRVVWAALTAEGARVQRRAAPVHLDGIATRFADRLGARELHDLAHALGALT